MPLQGSTTSSIEELLGCHKASPLRSRESFNGLAFSRKSELRLADSANSLIDFDLILFYLNGFVLFALMGNLVCRILWALSSLSIHFLSTGLLYASAKVVSSSSDPTTATFPVTLFTYLSLSISALLPRSAHFR